MPTALMIFLAIQLAGSPQYLEDRFQMPPGFRIYRAASAELCGGSYDIAFDGEGRLLVGDGTQVRRLADRDGDAIFDEAEVIATGLGPRGPQGLLVYGDRLYAVGGDGLQLFEGYRSGGQLIHRGRLGARFNTGGDHDAHTLVRGHDGFLYFISGDGGGTKERLHITEESSPALFERSCSVFRIKPDGKDWECLGTGGRNAPNLGINYLGELFSLDSDMEWHVDLPWWRPVRLHHWTLGGDQGWQDVGAYPPYFIDCLPGIFDVGRGSPDWGVFYEHRQFPPRYQDAFFVCDYLTKSATTGGYETTGRLFCFFLERDGAGWKAQMEVFARPKPGAADEAGKPIQFALVDIEVAPDGSLLLSDHHQGVWRIFYDPERKSSSTGCPPLFPAWRGLASDPEGLLDALLSLPQPASEWSRRREEEIRNLLGGASEALLKEIATSPREPLRRKLRALRLLAPSFADLPAEFVARLARDDSAEIRAQAAWLFGIRAQRAEVSFLLKLIDDPDPFVRRRAAEELSRDAAPEAAPKLIERLADPVRLVRYAAMTSLAHLPTRDWFDQASARPDLQARLRALVAADLRRDPPPGESVRGLIHALLEQISPGESKENRLDLLRVLGRFRGAICEGGDRGRSVQQFLAGSFPDPDPDIRREVIRLVGDYRVAEVFGKLLSALEAEESHVAQFHLAQAISRFPGGWTPEEEERAIQWFLKMQRGWFTEFPGKGLEFPHFWATVLTEFGGHHKRGLLHHGAEVDFSGQLGGVVIDLLADSEGAASTLISLYRAKEEPEARRRILSALGRVKEEKAGPFLREEYFRSSNPTMRRAALGALSRQPPDAANLSILAEGLGDDDQDTVRASALALQRYRLEPNERLAARTLGQLLKRGELFRPLERLLGAMSGENRPSLQPSSENEQRPSDGEMQSGRLFWKGWYERTFGHPFEPAALATAAEKSNEEIRDFLLSKKAAGGAANRGKKVFEDARCASCHGAGGKSEQIFGPELAGVTRRLSREEVADSLVYPSKQVADRFKATVIQVRGEFPWTGFITEQTADAVTLVDPERVHRIPRDEIQLMAPQETSLMPERLLNRLSWDEIRDLVAYVDELGSQPDTSEEWGGWRGPLGRGVSSEKDLPERWSATESLEWAVDLPSWGNSSPAVVGGRAYVTSQTADDNLIALAVDCQKGVVAWKQVLGKGRLKAHELHNMATPTPAADREHVWVLFGTGDLACLDLDGRILWQRDLKQAHGDYKILWGMGSSPFLFGDCLYVVCMHSGPSYVLAIDKKSGNDVWKAARDLSCRAEATDSYSTPALLQDGDRAELIVAGAAHITAYDPRTGKELWISKGLEINHDWGRTISSPTAREGIVVACSASTQGLGHAIALRGGGAGDVTESHRLWQYDKFIPDCPTPLIYEGRVYLVRDDGVGSCLDAKTGKVLWKKRLGPGDFKASPVAGDGKIYCLNVDGDCVVLESGPEGKVLAQNRLDGHFIASPAISRGRIYFRSRDRLYAVSRKS